MPDNDKTALAKLRMENAERCLASADIMLENDDYKSAANRSYYAIFHSMRSVLAIEGKDFKKHSAVISHFRKNYIKTGKFDVKFSTIISKMFEIRSESDYDDFFIISKIEVNEQINNAKLFLSTIKKYLTECSVFFEQK